MLQRQRPTGPPPVGHLEHEAESSTPSSVIHVLAGPVWML